MRLFFDCYVEQKGLPAIVTVKTFNGQILFYGKVYKNRFCLSLFSCEKNIVVSVTPLSFGLYTEYRYLRLPPTPCMRFSFSFTFRNMETNVQETFYLYDKNYLLPVKNATLYFIGD